MKFELTTAGNFYRKKDVEKYKEYGFKFDTTDFSNYDFTIKGFEEKDSVFIEIKDLQELKKIIDNFKCSVIIDFDPNTITIYDDYME